MGSGRYRPVETRLAMHPSPLCAEYARQSPQTRMGEQASYQKLPKQHRSPRGSFPSAIDGTLRYVLRSDRHAMGESATRPSSHSIWRALYEGRNCGGASGPGDRSMKSRAQPVKLPSCSTERSRRPDLVGGIGRPQWGGDSDVQGGSARPHPLPRSRPAGGSLSRHEETAKRTVDGEPWPGALARSPHEARSDRVIRRAHLRADGGGTHRRGRPWAPIVGRISGPARLLADVGPRPRLPLTFQPLPFHDSVSRVTPASRWPCPGIPCACRLGCGFARGGMRKSNGNRFAAA
jgi:hypothetical protein